MRGAGEESVAEHEMIGNPCGVCGKGVDRHPGRASGGRREEGGYEPPGRVGWDEHPGVAKVVVRRPEGEGRTVKERECQCAVCRVRRKG